MITLYEDKIIHAEACDVDLLSADHVVVKVVVFSRI